MPIYTYKARDTMGKSVRGKMEVDTKAELIDRLHKMGYMTTQVTEARSTGDLNIETLLDKIRPVGTEHMLMFYVQLSNMISAGIPILTCLDTLSNQIENKKLKDAVGSIARSVGGGESLSKAFRDQPRVFPQLFSNMVKAGEVSGKLDTVSVKFAEYFEHQEDLRQKIRSALFYPMILLVAGVAVMLFIVTFIIPLFAQIFAKSGIALPAPTLLLLKIGLSIKHFWYLGILAFVGCFLVVKFYINTEIGRLNFDKLKLKIPIIGSLHRRAALASFTRTLGTLTDSGVPILESLDITKSVMGNEVLSRVIANARSAVEKGEKLSGPLKISEEFPPDAVQMISVGEETGNLDTMLNKVADFYDMSVGYSIKKLTTVIEPLFLVIMGSLIGFIMISILLPMFDMIKVIKH
ncbi:MAG: type II secretion system F family protein [Candidatus Omnitrophica bacterium]|nr:type II secretion system F family protein [Candidatus Omnitrophota bacterium]